MKILQKRVIGLLAVLIVAFNASNAVAEKSQTNISNFELDRSYDARLFLSNTQVNLFDRLYPYFDEEKLGKDYWEWKDKDIDPLALFTPEENRKTRREMFLYEYSSNTLRTSDKEPNQDQFAFKSVLQNRFPQAVILMTSGTVKLVGPYEASYDDLPTLRKPNLYISSPKSILELTADLGLQWSTLGGSTLFLYNGSILISRFKSGYVSLADPYIDRPKAMTKHNKLLKRNATKSPRVP
jgi:hypothetical protein